MKFMSYRYRDHDNVGVCIDDKVVPLPFASMLELIEQMNEAEMVDIETLVSNGEDHSLPVEQVKINAPIPYPRRNVFCLGKNYAEHAREIKITKISDTGIPTQPIYFTKVAAPALGHGQAIVVSRQVTTQVDYEVELAVIIGKEGCNIRSEQAEEFIFGYTIGNDVSARDLQAERKQWFKGKSLDNFCPLGPVVVHKSAIPFPVELNIQCRVNGELRQDSNTRHLIFDLPYIISDLSQGLTLKPGDVILTGTPSGVGMGYDPPIFLQDGDTVECSIERIGTLTNRVIFI